MEWHLLNVVRTDADGVACNATSASQLVSRGEVSGWPRIQTRHPGSELYGLPPRQYDCDPVREVGYGHHN